MRRFSRLLALVPSIGLALLSAETRLGRPFTLTQATPVGELMANPAVHAGKTVQVSGKVTETCEMMGCWMNLADPQSNRRVRIKVNDGDMVFPKSAVGKMALAEGKMVKLELTREEAIAAARHEAEEQGRRFDPSSVKSGKIIYQIAGTGAIVQD
jgi:Domain of unknown function (DUF4920)